MMRFAGQAIGKIPQLAKWLTKGIGKEELALRLGMDAMGGTMSAIATPGDLGDKLIAGTTDALAGSLGGLAAGRLAGGKGMLGNVVDMAGSYGAAMGAMPISSGLIRAKDKLTGGRGETAWERMGREEQEKFAKQLEAQILSQYRTANPAVASVLGDPFLTENGLG